MVEKVTIMVLNVDLQCSCCYKKVKKLLCKFPQIRDQVYDEKQNTVTVTVLCCSPEKIREKLCCKGGKVIKDIEIRSPPKHKEPEKHKRPTENPEKSRPNGKSHPTLAEKPTPKDSPHPGFLIGHRCPSIFLYEPCCGPCSQGRPRDPCYNGHGCPFIFSYEPCCGPCSQGRPGGPCYNGYERPAWPIPCNNCYDNNHNYGYNNTNDGTNDEGAYNDFNRLRPCYFRPCDYNCLTGNNTSSSVCTTM